jgi:hypothetical protein
MAAGDALPFPLFNSAYRVTFPILDADGDLVTGATTPDSEISQDGGTFADATNEATEIATASGMYYLDLAYTEMDTSCTAIIVKCATAGAKTTPIVLYPRFLPTIATGTAQGGSSVSITLASTTSTADDYYNGCVVRCVNNTPTGVIGQARMIVDYIGSTHVAAVAAWTTEPTNGTTYEILGTETACSYRSNTTEISGDATAADNAESFFDGTGYAGTGNVIPTVTALGTQAKADVNAEVVDALNVDTYAEPTQEAPAATSTITKKLGYLYKAFRNKITQDATTLKLYNDDTSTVDHKATVSDSAGTFTRGELGTGP